MIEALVEYYDDTDDVPPPFHRLRKATHGVFIGDTVTVQEIDGSFLFPSPSRSSNSNPAIGCDQVKYVTGFTEKPKDLPDDIDYETDDEGSPVDPGVWSRTDYGHDFRQLLQDTSEAAGGRLQKVLRKIKGALSEAAPQLLSQSDDYKEYVVFYVDDEPVLQPKGSSPTKLQKALQTANIQHLNEGAGIHNGSTYEAECSVCGEEAFIAKSNLYGAGCNKPAFRTKQHAKSFSAHVCTTCAAKAKSAKDYLDDSRSDQIVRVGNPENRSKWYFFTTDAVDLNPITAALQEQVAANEVRKFWRALLGGQKPTSPKMVRTLCLGASDVAADRTSYLHGKHWPAVDLGQSVEEYLQYQETTVETKACGVQDHIANVSPAPARWNDKARVVGDDSSAPSSLSHEMMLAAIEGRRLPERHVRPLVGRIRGTSATVRSQDLSRVIPTLLWTYPMNKTSVAYRLGELLSLGDYLYYKMDNKSLMMSTRYYTKMSAQPQSVFGRLVSDMKTRLSQLQSRNGGTAVRIDKEITKILGEIDDVPRNFDMEQQAQFALGYYHNRQERFESAKAAKNEANE
jgi:hypothetical protein